MSLQWEIENYVETVSEITENWRLKTNGEKTVKITKYLNKQ